MVTHKHQAENREGNRGGRWIVAMIVGAAIALIAMTIVAVVLLAVVVHHSAVLSPVLALIETVGSPGGGAR